MRPFNIHQVLHLSGVVEGQLGADGQGEYSLGMTSCEHCGCEVLLLLHCVGWGRLWYSLFVNEG